MQNVYVGVIMGSQSDWPTMKESTKTLDCIGVKYETRIVSAHRTPDRLYEYADGLQRRGLKIVIEGAGGAAHLPGMIASKTTLPVIGVPIKSDALNGIDSLYSILQMPKGYPVATMAIGKAGAINAAILATSILALENKEIEESLKEWRKKTSNSVPQEPQEP